MIVVTVLVDAMNVADWGCLSLLKDQDTKVNCPSRWKTRECKHDFLEYYNKGNRTINFAR